MIASWILRIVNILVAVLSLALLLRALLPWFKVPLHHPVMRVLTTLTEPLVRPLRRTMGGGGRAWTGRTYVDLVPVVAIFILWLAQVILARLLALVIAPPLWLLRPAEDWGRWLTGLVNLLVQLYTLLLLLRILLEWMRVSYSQPVMRFLWDITEPLLAPIRRRLPIVAGLDFTPVVAVLLLAILQMLLNTLILAIF